MSRSTDATEAYVRAINDRVLTDLTELFAEDAVAINARATLTGREEIVAFYRDAVFASDLVIETVAIYDAGETSVIEFVAHMSAAPGGTPMLDVITLNADGLISRIAVYAR